jgi:ADP-ribose pyrophosphatase YjhB (NUDIX family)
MLGVRVLISDGESVLLVRHTYRGGWLFPGGAIKRGELAGDAARREAFEETGLALRDVELFGVFTALGDGVTGHIVVFVAGSWERAGPGDIGGEIAEARWFPIDALPVDITPGTGRRVADFRAGLRGGHGRW